MLVLVNYAIELKKPFEFIASLIGTSDSLFPVGVVDDIVLDVLEKFGGEDKIIERFVGCVVDFLFVAHPFAVTFVDENDVFTDAEHGIHVVSVDYGGHSVFVGYVAEQFINQN